MSEWISVSTCLPEPEKDVLCCCRLGVNVAMTVAGRFYVDAKRTELRWMSFESEDYTKFHITHWMPLPTPPKDTE